MLKNETTIYENKNGQLMINATNLAKPFDKFAGNFLRLENTKRFINQLNTDNDNPRYKNFNILIVIRGGNEQQITN